MNHPFTQLHVRCNEDHGEPDPFVLFHVLCVSECLLTGIRPDYLTPFRCVNSSASEGVSRYGSPSSEFGSLSKECTLEGCSKCGKQLQIGEGECCDRCQLTYCILCSHLPETKNVCEKGTGHSFSPSLPRPSPASSPFSSSFSSFRSSQQNSHKDPPYPFPYSSYTPHYFIPLPFRPYFSAPTPAWFKSLPPSDPPYSIPPMAVHCHGGVGRTGVLILAHMYTRILLTASVEGMIQALEDEDMRLLPRLCRVRLQRDSVQGPRQCAFLYHYVHCLLRLSWSESPPSRLTTSPSSSLSAHSTSLSPSSSSSSISSASSSSSTPAISKFDVLFRGKGRGHWTLKHRYEREKMRIKSGIRRVKREGGGEGREIEREIQEKIEIRFYLSDSAFSHTLSLLLLPYLSPKGLQSTPSSKIVRDSSFLGCKMDRSLLTYLPPISLSLPSLHMTNLSRNLRIGSDS